MGQLRGGAGEPVSVGVLVVSIVVLFSSSLSPGLRGVLTKWMIEPLPGCFVADLSTRVRQEIWSEVADWVLMADGAFAAVVYQSEAEQGFTAEQVGDHRHRALVDFGGILLVARRGPTSDDSTKTSEVEVPW